MQSLPFLLFLVYTLLADAMIKTCFDYFGHMIELDGKRCNSSHIVFIESKVELLYCAMKCGNDNNCTGFTYNSDTKTCTGCLQPYDPAMTLESAHGQRYFKGSWFTFEGRAFMVSTSILSFDESMEYCRCHGGHLARIDNERLATYIQQRAWDFVNVWIGMTDIGHEGKWTWINGGDEANFTLWSGNQPDGGVVHNCACINKGYGYKWADRDCEREFNALCAK